MMEQKSRGNAGKGRVKGSKNRTTVIMKEAILAVYADLQEKHGGDHAHFSLWAAQNPTEFYKLASKLLPHQVEASVEAQVVHEIKRTIVRPEH